MKLLWICIENLIQDRAFMLNNGNGIINAINVRKVYKVCNVTDVVFVIGYR